MLDVDALLIHFTDEGEDTYPDLSLLYGAGKHLESLVCGLHGEAEILRDLLACFSIAAANYFVKEASNGATA